MQNKRFPGPRQLQDGLLSILLHIQVGIKLRLLSYDVTYFYSFICKLEIVSLLLLHKRFSNFW